MVKIFSVQSIAVLLLFSASGCLGLQQQPPSIDLYTLEYSLPRIADTTSLPVVLQVERFGAAPPFDTTRMIYRSRAFERNAYVYHQWQSPPGNLVAYQLAADLQNSGRFRAVSAPHGRMTATHTLQGSIEAFHEHDDAAGNALAVLELTLTLTRRDQPDPVRRIVMQQTYQARKPFAAGQPPELARAMSQAMADIAVRVVQDIYDALKMEEG